MVTKQLPFKKLVLAATVLSAIGSVSAQDVANSENDASAQELVLEEVTVTAQKRQEFLQDTPIAIAVFNQDALETIGVSDLTDLRGDAPSLSISSFAADRVAPLLFIRGMGSIDVQTTKDAAVGLYLDGVSLGRASGLATNIADLERIEVLRGPQGTLYGRNTTGGAINFITRKPDDQFGFKLQLSAGNYGFLEARVSLNAPVTDKLFIKLAYMQSDIDGWVENTSNLPDQIDFFEDDNDAGNLAVRWLASDNFTIDYSYDFSNLDYGNAFYQMTFGQSTDRQDKVDQLFGLSPGESNVSGHNLTMTWELGSVTLRSITGYRELENSLDQNYIGNFYQENQVDQEQFSQEFQAIGNMGDRFEYVAGLYYYDEESDEAQLTNMTPWFGFIWPGVSGYDAWSVKAESKSMAIYGQGTWTPDVLDNRLSLTLGMRYTEDDRKAEKSYLRDLFIGPILPPVVLNGDKDFSDFSPSLTINYAFNDDVNGYAKVVTGYRAGGFNTRSTFEGFEDGFNKEDVTSLEVGVKSDLWENRLRLNMAAYYNKYKNLQVDQVRPGIIFTDTLNTGDATVKGAEVELTALLAQGLTLNAFYAYMDAEYDEYIDNNVDLSDVKNMPYAPKHMSKVALKYVLPVSYGEYRFDLDYQYQSKTYSGPNPDTDNDSYGLWNIRVQLAGISLGSGDLRLAAWGRNLGDKEYTIATSHLGAVSSIFGTPRTYGLDVIYQF